MKFQKIIVFFAVLSLTSCDKSAFKQFDEFEDNRWLQSDVRSYQVDLPKTDNYDLLVNFSSAYGSPFAEIPLKITVNYPDATSVTEEFSLRLLDEKGTVLSDCSGDFCDLEQTVFAGKKLDAGRYTITVANQFDHAFLPNVLGMGIRIVESEN